jgi:perosamine synthetase
MKFSVPYTKPSITELEVSYATDAAANGWGADCYAYIEKFETAFKEYLGVQYAIATSSCTGALHMGLAALGIGRGDEVILADTNWIATVAPVVHLGAKPVFVDILTDTWCLNPEQVRAAITPNTKAIIAVHLYGSVCDMEQLLQIGDIHGIPVIEDAAEAIGSSTRGRCAGSIGAFGAFSFHGTKTLTTGEGGMFVTSDPALYERVLTIGNHGRARNQSKQFWSEVVGFKYKMSNIQAAIGCAQLERVQELVDRKREIFAAYKSGLRSIESIHMNSEPPHTTNGMWMPTIVFDEEACISRERLLLAFQEEGIDARIFFWPLSSLPMFTSAKYNKNAWSIPERAINLPSFHDISDESLQRVIAVIKGLVK